MISIIVLGGLYWGPLILRNYPIIPNHFVVYHNLTSVKGGYIGDYIGEYCRAYLGRYWEFRLWLMCKRVKSVLSPIKEPKPLPPEV